jgi:hypothetical protein
MDTVFLLTVEAKSSVHSALDFKLKGGHFILANVASEPLNQEEYLLSITRVRSSIFLPDDAPAREKAIRETKESVMWTARHRLDSLKHGPAVCPDGFCEGYGVSGEGIACMNNACRAASNRLMTHEPVFHVQEGSVDIGIPSTADMPAWASAPVK